MKFQFQSLDQLKNSAKTKGPLVVLLSEEEAKKPGWIGRLPSSLRERARKGSEKSKDKLKAGARVCVPALERDEEDLLITILPEKREAFYFLELARDTLKQAVSTTTKELTLVLVEDKHHVELADAFGSALATRVFQMPVFGKRAEKPKPFQLRGVTLSATTRDALTALERGHGLGEGTNLARFLATLPPNVLDAGNYVQRARELARTHKLGFRFYSNRELKRMGAGAFTAVDQANPASKGGIVELTYSPKKGKGRAIHLVGKGMCFDTGGYDVKINGGMGTMKGDMQGSAVALATLVAAATLKLPLKMKAFLAVTENHISPLGYKADEVITALNGLSIEVVNTDAEGRMVLADTLTLASRGKPEIVIDYATLTGAAVRSLGTKFSAGFTNRKELHTAIVDAGEQSGERVWTFPLDSTYFRVLDSDVADTLQCTKGGGPDHIHAACFLSKFLEKETPWVHIDLSASENSGGLAHVDSLFTGFGVRWTHEFLKRFL